MNKQGEGRFIIECMACNCRPSLLGKTREEAISLWNKRA